MLLTEENKKKIFESCSFYIDEEYSEQYLKILKAFSSVTGKIDKKRLDPLEAIILKEKLPLLICELIEQSEVLKLLITKDLCLNINFSFLRCIHENNTFVIKVDENTIIPNTDLFKNLFKFRFEESNMVGVFNSIKNNNIELSIPTELNYPLHEIYIEFNIKDDEYSIKNKYVYIKDLYKSIECSDIKYHNDIFTFEDFLSRKEEVLNNLKLLEY